MHPGVETVLRITGKHVLKMTESAGNPSEWCDNHLPICFPWPVMLLEELGFDGVGILGLIDTANLII